MTSQESGGKSEFRRWLLVVAAALGISVSTINTYSLGVFIRPLQETFGWSRAEISSGLTISATLGTLLAPIIGLFVDRYGARRIGIFGAAFYCAATAGLAAAGESIWSWWALWLIVAFGGVLVKPMVWTAAVSSLFVKRRGLALALALCGTGLGSGFAPILTERLIDSSGWRIAYLGLAGIWAVATLPMLLLFFHDSTAPISASGIRDRSSVAGLDVASGYRSLWFLKLAGATFFATLVIISIIVHFVPLLQGAGFSSASAAQLAAIFGIASITGRIATGVLLDRFPGPIVGGIVLFLPCIACLLLLTGINFTIAVAAAVLLGLALGGELDVAAYLSARFFGLRNYGTLFGSITSMLSLGTALGPLLAGLVYDHFGSYDYWLWLMIPASLTASVLVATLGRYPNYPARDVQTSGSNGDSEPVPST